MNKHDEQLCKQFDLDPEDTEKEIEKYESGQLDDMEFGEPVEGRPKPKLRQTTVKLYDFEIAAIDRAAQLEGISRSEFIRRSIDNELVALA